MAASVSICRYPAKISFQTSHRERQWQKLAFACNIMLRRDAVDAGAGRRGQDGKVAAANKRNFLS